MLNSRKNKTQCEHCKKWYSKKSVQKARDNRMLCGICRKCHVITNPFYQIPQKNKTQNKQIGNFNMSEQEKNMLYKQFMSRGFSSEEAWKKVDKKSRMLRRMRRTSRQSKISSQNGLNEQKQGSEQQKEEFLRGLGMR